MDMNFQEAIKSGLSKIDLKSLEERQRKWKTIYPTNTCLFIRDWVLCFELLF